MTTSEQQNVAENHERLRRCIPVSIVQDRVRTFLAPELEEGDPRRFEEKDVFPSATYVARRLVREVLEPKLIEALGENAGRRLAHFLARMAAVYVAVRTRVYDFTGVDRLFFEQQVDAEIDFACTELMRLWHDVLVLFVWNDARDTTHTPSGSIKLDALLFPKTSGVTEPLGSAVPRSFTDMYPKAQTWRDVLLHGTHHIAMDESDLIAVWTTFVHEVKVVVAALEDREPGIGFLLDRDENREYRLQYLPDEDYYVFGWRPSEA